MATETLSVKIMANASNFSSELSKMSDSIDKVNDDLEGLSKLGDKFKEVGAKMALTGTAIVGSVGAVVAKGAEWQSSVESTQFLYSNLDKSVQTSISNNSKNAKAIGLTTQQYKNGATNIATYYKNMGLTAGETAKLSGSTMDLVADLGAVADVPFDDALGDFKSALMGNYEAVDKYGISLSASTLQNSEFVKGLGKSWNSLSDNEKMMAAYYEMLRQGSSAQGLAKQEASSFTMQFKLLKEQIGETVGKIGSTLLPVLAPLVQKFADVAEKMGKWVEEHPKLTQAILLVIGGIGLLLATLGPILMIIGTCITSFVGLSAVAGGLGISIGALVGPIGLVIGIIVGLIAMGVALASNWDSIKAFAVSLGQKIGEVWNSIKQWTVSTWNSLTRIVSQAWQTICNAVQVGVMLIGEILNMAVQIITLPFQFIWQNCKGIVITVWNAISSFLSGIISTIASFISAKFKAISNFISNILKTIQSIFGNIWNAIKSLLSSILSSIFSVVSSRFNAMKSTVNSISNSTKSVVSSAWNGIKSVVSSVLGFIVSIVSSKFEQAKSKVSSVITGMKSIVSSGLNAIKGFFNGCKLSFPKIKLPHFSISGKFNLKPPSVPRFSVKWFSKGGIFKKPSVFGGVGVGDGHNGMGSGAEAVLPIDKLPELLGLDDKEKGGDIVLNIENFNNNREQDIKQLLRELEFYRKRANRSVGGAY